MAHDKGESDVQSNLDWVEDEGMFLRFPSIGDPTLCLLKEFIYIPVFVITEPDCAVTDCWAQGSVPINVYPSTPRSVVLDVLSEEPPVQQEGSDERFVVT